MKKENELKELLDRLKGEVRSSSAPEPGRPEEPRGLLEAGPAELSATAPVVPAPRAERPPAPPRYDYLRSDRPPVPAGANLIWSENKETMLFGMLASLIAMLGGSLAGLDYVILIGAVSFMLFSFIMCLTLFGYYLNFKKKNSEGGLLSERVDQLSRRLEALSAKGFTVPSHGLPSAHGKDKELEHKVDELRTLVKALARVVEGQNAELR
ncbi:MAG: hypothetical protein WCW52_06075 [Elusimicrobiales bacterium]|jgi:hypothetical protein